MSAFALLIPPATLTGHLHRPTERSSTTWRILKITPSTRHVHTQRDVRFGIQKHDAKLEVTLSDAPDPQLRYVA